MIKAENMHSKQRVTPFDGRVIKAAVKYTVVRGNLVYDGEVGPPAGDWINPMSIQQ